MTFVEKLRTQPRWLTFSEAIIIVLAIGEVDFQTGYEASVFVFYSIPILLVVWCLGRNAGLWISVFSAAVWTVADFMGRSGPIDMERAWNMSVQWIFFVFIVIAGAALKGQRDESRSRAALLERFHTLAQISPVGIFRIGLDGALIYVNGRWRESSGLKDLESLPGIWTDAFHPDDRSRVAGEWARAVGESRPCGFEARFQHPDGRTVWVLGQVAPEPDGTGGIAGYVGAITDMTELRRLEWEVLEISEREQQRIGQDLHDDLCQQLVAIQYAASTLRNGLPAADAGARHAAGEIADLVKDSVVHARKMARRIFPVHLDHAGLMSALQELSANSSRVFGLPCRFECPEPVLFEDNATSAHLYRIVQEALSNAIRHGQPRTVVIALTNEEDRVELTISDDGRGLPALPAESEGMGLHIMHYRSRMIGATLRVERRPEGGTIVRCTLRQGGRRLRQLVEAAEAVPARL